MIIGLTGRAFSGKDTVGRYLAIAHNFACIAFADPIRDALTAALYLDPRVFRPEHKEQVIDWIGQSPRQLMQTLGTEWGRNLVKPSLWVDITERRIRESLRAGDTDIVITDVRFPGEAKMIWSLGGVIWRIDRPGAATTERADHPSEHALDGYEVDYRLLNDGTIEQLHELIDAALFPAVERS